MSISKTLIVTLSQDKSKPKEKFFIYRNDVGVDMYIELSNLTYQFDNKRNNFKYANAVFKTPEGKVFTVDYLGIVDNKVVFSFIPSVIKNMQVIGKYEVQFQLYDANLNRVTIPPITLEVKEPIGQTTLEIEEAVVDYAYVGKSMVARDIKLFAMEDGYIKTVWETGDLITAVRLNNMEDGIYNNRIDIDLLKSLLIKAPTYTKPTVSIRANVSNVEMGKVISPALTVSFVRNDAGSATSVVIKEGNEVLANAYNYTVPSFKITGDKVYKTEVSYGDGGVKNNNLGQPDSTGQIKAGTITATTTIKAYRGYFGFCSDSSTIPTASEIRNQTVKGLNLSNGNTISVTTSASSRLVCFAYPSTLRDCTKIRYENLNDDENKSAFSSTILEIPDASGENPISYRVYYYIAPIPFGTTATFTLTV